jgi:MYND finger
MSTYIPSAALRRDELLLKNAVRRGVCGAAAAASAAQPMWKVDFHLRRPCWRRGVDWLRLRIDDACLRAQASYVEVPPAPSRLMFSLRELSEVIRHMQRLFKPKGNEPYEVANASAVQLLGMRALIVAKLVSLPAKEFDAEMEELANFVRRVKNFQTCLQGDEELLNLVCCSERRDLPVSQEQLLFRLPTYVAKLMDTPGQLMTREDLLSIGMDDASVSLALAYKLFKDSPSRNCSPLKNCLVPALEGRSELFRAFKKMDAAWKDARDATIIAQQQTDMDNTILLERMYSLLGFATIDCSRPHHSSEFVESLSKEVCVGQYHPSHLFCANCFVKPSEDVMLRLCTGCRSAWFCGDICNNEGWGKFHAAACNGLTEKRRKPLCFPADSEKYIVDTISRDRRSVFFSGKAGARVSWYLLMRDEYGTVFDSLSDNNVIFA